MKRVIENYSLTNKEALELLPFVNQSGLNNISDIGRVKRKKVLGVWRYDKNSINNFLTSFKRDDYYQYSEVVNLLKDNGVCDEYKYFGRSENDKPMCKYIRKNPHFPLTVKNLIENGYLKKDDDISPILIRKDSVIKTIKLFKSGKLSQQ